MLFHVLVVSTINFGNLVHANYDTNFILNFISGFGYDVELHRNVQTEDGYLLDLHRISHSKNSNSSRPVAFLMHGLLGSAEHWIITGPEKSLAFLLADQGYDVWMGNARGCYHSRKHVSLDPDTDLNFWNFSWHEIGVYDLPAMIDYVLEHTGSKILLYIGHSQGTTAFFVMASSRPEYNQKIKLMVALAPVAYMGNIPQATFRIVSFLQTRLLKLLGALVPSIEFVPNNNLVNIAGELACSETIAINEICANILFLLCGYDSEQLDRSTIPAILKTSPAGASIKQLYHYQQSIDSGEFRQYDYGFLQNLLIYGESKPPSYELGRISAPIALFYSKNDLLSSVEDVEHLYVDLPNPVVRHLIQFEKFNHLDFLWATGVIDLLYKHVFNVLDEYN